MQAPRRPRPAPRRRRRQWRAQRCHAHPASLLRIPSAWRVSRDSHLPTSRLACAAQPLCDLKQRTLPSILDTGMGGMKVAARPAMRLCEAASFHKLPCVQALAGRATRMATGFSTCRARYRSCWCGSVVTGSWPGCCQVAGQRVPCCLPQLVCLSSGTSQRSWPPMPISADNDVLPIAPCRRPASPTCGCRPPASLWRHRATFPARSAEEWVCGCWHLALGPSLQLRRGTEPAPSAAAVPYTAPNGCTRLPLPTSFRTAPSVPHVFPADCRSCTT